MNLVTDHWIPVVTTKGKPDYVSLMQLFTNGEQYADLSVRPHERVAIMRLFICIAQAALNGPKDKDDWKNALNKLPPAAKEYLEKWKDSFELFDKNKPFLQIANLKSKTLTPISKLDLFLATGNTTTLFDHESNSTKKRIIDSKKIPLMLLTFQCFSPGGMLPVTEWDEVKTKKIGNPDSLCVTGKMYHTFICGKNLFENIYLNVLPKSLVAQHYGTVNKDNFWGSPVWEMMPISPKNTVNITNATRTYLGRLVPLCRWIKIEPDCSGIHCGKGFDYPVLDKKGKKTKKSQQKILVWPAEPTASVVMNKEKTERFLMGAKPDKAIWRELPSLLVMRTADSVGGPLAFQNPLPENFDIYVGALIRNQAAIEGMVESVYAVSVKLLKEEGRALYMEGVAQAERQSLSLGYAIEAYRRNIDQFWDQRVKQAKNANKLKAKLHSKAMYSYWTAIEKQRYLLMKHVDAFGTDQLETTREVWHKVLHKTAREAYITVCGQETPRQIRAFALGWKKLFAEKETEDIKQNIDGGKE